MTFSLSGIIPNTIEELTSVIIILSKEEAAKDIKWLLREQKGNNLVSYPHSQARELASMVQHIEELPTLLGSVVKTAVFVESRKKQKRLEQLVSLGLQHGLLEASSDAPESYGATRKGIEWTKSKLRQLGKYYVRSLDSVWCATVTCEHLAKTASISTFEDLINEMIPSLLPMIDEESIAAETIEGMYLAAPYALRRALRYGVDHGWIRVDNGHIHLTSHGASLVSVPNEI